MEVQKVSWCAASGTCIGIIRARDVLTDEVHIYVGIGDGLSEEADIAKILAHGNKYELDVFLRMIGEITKN